MCRYCAAKIVKNCNKAKFHSRKVAIWPKKWVKMDNE